MTDPAPDPVKPARAHTGRRTMLHAGWSIGVITALAAAAGPLEQSAATADAVQATVSQPAAALTAPSPAPLPLLAAGKPVSWWFAYKFSSQSFPGNAADPNRSCSFGGTLRRDGSHYSQHYAVASSANPDLVDGPGLLGTSNGDPLGATFGQVYNGRYYYVIWNDQFYNDPARDGPECDDKQCGSPWGHSKGILAWDQNGNGLIIQVTTPSWPAAGSSAHIRKDGNTLGCVSNDNNIANAQDFFALQLNREDVKTILRALAVASVSTDISNPQIVNRRIDGVTPLPDIDPLVGALGHQSRDKAFLDVSLSSGVRLITKPSALHVPPWQFVSSRLGGENLLTATWWAYPKIASTRSAADVHCWDPLLTAAPGRVDVAVSANWEGTPVAFTGGPNHAKLGVSLDGGHGYAIFGDLNQQGQLGDPQNPNAPNCGSSQNGRGGMFFVIANPTLRNGIVKLIAGKVAPYLQ